MQCDAQAWLAQEKAAALAAAVQSWIASKASNKCPGQRERKGCALGGADDAAIRTVVAAIIEHTPIWRGTATGAGAEGIIDSLVGAKLQTSCLRDEIARSQKERDHLAPQLK